MMRHPLTYFIAGAASVYLYHRFVMPMPSKKA